MRRGGPGGPSCVRRACVRAQGAQGGLGDLGGTLRRQRGGTASRRPRPSSGSARASATPTPASQCAPPVFVGGWGVAARYPAARRYTRRFGPDRSRSCDHGGAIERVPRAPGVVWSPLDAPGRPSHHVRVTGSVNLAAHTLTSYALANLYSRSSPFVPSHFPSPSGRPQTTPVGHPSR